MKRSRFVYWGVVVGIGSILLLGCSFGTSERSQMLVPSFDPLESQSSQTTLPSFRSRLKVGDRHVGWALTYFESWRLHHQPRYLFLAEDHIYSAVGEFAALQAATSPRINEFYVVRERRVRSCRFLAELQFTAASYGLTLKNSPAALGCIF